jgi:hypothetical protein
MPTCLSSAVGVAEPVDRLPDAEMIQDVGRGAGTVIERERAPHGRAAAMIRPVDQRQPASKRVTAE